MKQRTLSYKTKTCTKCHGTGRHVEQPIVYIDMFGNEYPSTEWTLTGFMGSKILPACKLQNKEIECDRCHGNRVEHYINKCEKYYVCKSV